jgi:capsular polysaccharide export protein
MNASVHIFSAGLWRLRDEVASMSGLTPRRAFFTAGRSGAVAGWGHKPTANRARREALRRGLPYLAFEDGFLRSVKPGAAVRPSSMIMDRTGIYYDASAPSDLETALETGGFSDAELAEAAGLRRAIALRHLSKYNNGRDRLPIGLGAAQRGIVLMVDQTFRDASIAGALADAVDFGRMAEAALAENPGATLIAKLHPEVISGTKRGYLGPLLGRRDIHVLAENVSPWALLDLRPKVYTVSSQIGFEALMAGCRVVCFGVPFYAGWGLTDDRRAVPRRTRRCTRDELAAAVYVRYSRYFDAWSRRPVNALTAIDQLDFLRRRFLENDRPVVVYRMPRWKRRAVAVLLDGPHGKPRFAGRLTPALRHAKSRGGAIAAWGAKALAIRGRCEAEGVTCLTIEDGFIRSAGLGAAFVPSLSLAIDDRGIYYDASRPSALEDILNLAEIDGVLLAEAHELRTRIVEAKITKYNLAASTVLPPLPPDRLKILAVGQVADDEAVRLGHPGGMARDCNVNASLLAAVRRRHPSGFVIFKPHPDVERLGRAGALTAEQERRDADWVARDFSLELLYAAVDRVETFGSLAGFEALLRGIPVTAHGMPFFAGWGLSEDLLFCPRRTRRRSLDELVAAALILYPRYFDPESGLPCPPRVALDRIARSKERDPPPLAWLAALAGRGIIAWRRLLALPGTSRRP